MRHAIIGAALCIAMVLSTACTPPGRPSDPATATVSAAAPTSAGGHGSQAAGSTDGLRCPDATRTTTIASTRVWPSPERAVAAMDHPGPALGFDPVVRRRGISFYARNGTASYLARPVRRGWSVVRKTEPSCPPRAVRLARRYEATSDPGVACRRPHGGSYAVVGGDDSTLEALRWFTSGRRDVNPSLQIPRGPYVFIGRERRDWFRYAHITAAGLRAHIRVYNNERRGAGVDQASWCAPGD